MKKIDKSRFYVEATGLDPEAYKIAIAQAIGLAEDNSAVKKITVLTPKKDPGDILLNVFTAPVVARIKAGGFKHESWPLIKTEALTTYRSAGTSSEIVVACGLNDKELFEVEDLSWVTAVIAVSWYPGQLDKWLKTWTPPELRKKPSTIVAYPTPSCIVQTALKDLDDYLDWSKSIHSPREEEQAAIYFKTLHHYESPLDPEAIGAHLVSKLNWRAVKAREAEAILHKLNSGGRGPKGSRISKPHYDQWKRDCEDK